MLFFDDSTQSRVDKRYQGLKHLFLVLPIILHSAPREVRTHCIFVLFFLSKLLRSRTGQQGQLNNPFDLRSILHFYIHQPLLLVPSMGRQKQSTPLQRAPSSDWVHIPANDSEVSEKPEIGSVTTIPHNKPKKVSTDSIDTAAETPGLTQLLICVLGIYAAL